MVPSSVELRTARWVGVLFLLVVLLQRFALPGVPNLALLVPAVAVWAALALARRIAVVDRTRLLWWFAAATTTCFVMLIQDFAVAGAEISVTAWGLVMAVWLPFVLRLVENGPAAYLQSLRYVSLIATILAVLTIAMVGTQLMGIAYRDWFAAVVPADLQLGGFVLTYPLTYGSNILKGSAWIGLEPSMVSAQLGIGLLAALFVRARWWTVVVLILGLVATASGSGIVIVIVGVLVMLLHRCRQLLTKYALLGGVTVVLATLTPFGSLLLDRSSEFSSSGSSASLRAFEPYGVLFPRWTEQLSGVLWGYGPGSSQRIVTDTNVLGLLVPSPAKVFFEYGLVAGVVLAAFLLGCYWGGPSRAMGLSLLVSLWLLQPGVTTMVIVAPLLAMVTLWSPRPGLPIEKLLPEREPLQSGQARRQADAVST